MERADEAGAEPERAVMDEADEECAACFSIALACASSRLSASAEP
jgi:hypothetical protein